MMIVNFLNQTASLRRIALTCCLMMVLFSLPLSTSGLDIFLVLSLSLILMTPEYWTKLKTAFSQPWFILFLLFFIYVCFACFWSEATAHAQWVVLGKYLKLLYLPILAVGFHQVELRQRALHVFMGAMGLVCCVAWIKWLHLIKFHGDDDGYIFKNHIMTGYMMDLAAYLALAAWIKSKGNQRVGYGCLFLLFSYHVLFIGTGRMAYLTYFVLMVIFILQYLSWKKSMAGLLLVLTVVLGAFYLSPAIQLGVENTQKELLAYQHNEKNTSLGYRVQFHQFAYDLFERHPWIGSGTSGFIDAFEKENPVPQWGARLFEPHSQYWLIAVDFGVIGLLLFTSLFIGLFAVSSQLKETGRFAAALLLSFLFACMTDSFLLYSGTGYVLVLLMSVCLGEGLSEPLPAARVVKLPGWVAHRLFGDKPRVA